MGASDFDPEELERMSQQHRAARESTLTQMLGSDDPVARATAVLRRTGHGNALRGRELAVTPGGTVIARRPSTLTPRPQGVRERMQDASSRAGDAARTVVQVAAAPGAQLASAYSGGGMSDSAAGRLFGAIVWGSVALMIGSLISGRFFNVQLGPWPARVNTSPAPSGGSPAAIAANNGSGVVLLGPAPAGVKPGSWQGLR